MKTFLRVAALTLAAVLLSGQSFAADAGDPAGRWTGLSGRALVDPNGKKVGSVSDAVLGEDWKVRYLIVSQGGLLGVGDRLVPVPLSHVRIPDKGPLVVSVPRERIENQPFFYGSDWTWMNFNDDRLEQQVQAYYGEESPGAGEDRRE